MSLGHVGLSVGHSQYKAMRDFYVATLGPLGYKVYLEKECKYLGLRGSNGPDFWLHSGGEDVPIPSNSNPQTAAGTTHVAFAVSSKSYVDLWYRNAVKAGGVPNGEPGVREYHKDYYAAYVLDPLGNNIEAVFFSPWWLQLLKAAPWVAAGALGAVVSSGVSWYVSRGG